MKTTPKTKLPWRRVSLVALMNFLTASAIFGSEIAPPSPEKPWSPPGLNAYERELAQGHFSNAEVEISPEKIYELPELIDIAERSNPNTRIAWEGARQAASAVGLSQSAYFPYLVASAGAGYERAFLPFPSLKQGPGPGDVSMARESLMMTNVGFNATHQQIVFTVTRRFYELSTARQKV